MLYLFTVEIMVYNDNNGYSMYAEGNGANFFIKNGAVGGSLKQSIKCLY